MDTIIEALRIALAHQNAKIAVLKERLDAVIESKDFRNTSNGELNGLRLAKRLIEEAGL